VGLDIRTAEFLLHCHRRLSVDYSEVATLGHQRVMLSQSERHRVSNWLGVNAYDETYADFFLKALGAANPRAIDASRYEGAQIQHNLNAELAPELHGRFSCLIDGGTLEHVFDIRQSLKSCMQMVRIGGHFIICQMANNCMGHGFYQFSPELFYSVLVPTNGYEVRRMYLNESGVWYQPLSPEEVGDRIQARTRNETFIFVAAQRISDVTPFLTPPHQSDYVSNLDESAPDTHVLGATQPQPGLLKRLRRHAGEFKRKQIYARMPWLSIPEERYNRYCYLRADTLSNRRRFRLIGKRLPVTIFAAIAVVFELFEAHRTLLNIG